MSLRLEPREKEGSTVYLSKSQWAELRSIARAEGFSRNDVIAFLLKFSLAEYDRHRSQPSQLASVAQ